MGEGGGALVGGFDVLLKSDFHPPAMHFGVLLYQSLFPPKLVCFDGDVDTC